MPNVKEVILQMSLYSLVNYKPQPKIKEQKQSSKCVTSSGLNYR